MGHLQNLLWPEPNENSNENHLVDQKKYALVSTISHERIIVFDILCLQISFSSINIEIVVYYLKNKTKKRSSIKANH